VKLDNLLPVIVVAYLLVTQHFDWKKLLDDTMRWKTALLGILMLGILGLLVVRSGNDAPSSVSSFELLFRSLLDQIMYTRPRSKEFLFGHPALWMGLSLLAMQTKVKPEFQSKVLGWAVLLVILGSIGQASIVNTFCHLHTPLMISMPRVFIGIVFGMFWGWLAMFPVKKYLSRFI
jgi:FtsH-binding integral membrane protein